ncbi:dinB, partial [Acrasis kona]
GSASWLQLEEVIKDRILYYAVVKLEGKRCYLCLCSHFFYLTSENMENEPVQFSFEQLSTVTTDPDDSSLIQITLSNSKITKEFVFETSQKDQLLREFRVHWKNDRVTRNMLSGSASLNVVKQKIKFTRRKESSLIQSSKNQRELFSTYVIALDDEYKKQGADDLTSDTKLKSITFKHNNGNLIKVSMVKERSMQSPQMNLRTLAEKVATCEYLRNNVDYKIVSSDGFDKDRSNQILDKSVWSGYQISLQTLENVTTRVVIVTRRSYLPPFGDKYEDIVFEMSGPNSEVTLLEKIVHSLHSTSNCFIYDTLLLRTRLESLTADDDFYTWCYKRLQMEPEVVNDPEVTSLDDFMTALKALTISNKVSQELLHRPTKIENKLFSNSNVPREQLSAYLAFKMDSGVINVGDCFLNEVVDRIKNPNTDEKVKSALSQLLDYALHLKPKDEPFVWDQSLDVRIDKVEFKASSKQDMVLSTLTPFDSYTPQEAEDDSALTGQSFFESDPNHAEAKNRFQRVAHQQAACRRINEPPCHMNTTFFSKLLQLNYFTSATILTKLITFAIRTTKEYNIMHHICTKALQLVYQREDVKIHFCNDQAFLHAMAGLLRYDDHALLMMVCRLFCKLTADSVHVKDWFASTGYFYFVADHISCPTTQHDAIALLINVLQNCMDSTKRRGLIAEQVYLVSLLLERIKTNYNTMSVGRLEMLRAASGAILVLSADEEYCGLFVERLVIKECVKLIHMMHQKLSVEPDHNVASLLMNIFAFLMVAGSFEGYRDHVVRANYNDESTIVEMTCECVSVLLNSQDKHVDLLRVAFGLLLVLSASSDALEQMNKSKLCELMVTCSDKCADVKTKGIINTLSARL